MKTTKIQTKKNEIVITTSDTSMMHKKYLVSDLFRKWMEPYVDSDTGEIIEIERSEIVLKRGTYLDVDQLAVIQFHLQTGDVKEVTVSDQKRLGHFGTAWGVIPWQVTVQLGKKYKVILLAQNIFQALDIVEVNAKIGEDNEKYFRFLVYARDVDNAKVLIEKVLKGKVKDTPYAQLMSFVDVLAAEHLLQINVITATKVKCHSVIGLEFTEAYNRQDDGEEEVIDIDINIDAE